MTPFLPTHLFLVFRSFQSMYKNELAIVSVKPDMAYGELGRKPDIPPDSRITYLFGLLHFEKQKDVSEMTWAQVT